MASLYKKVIHGKPYWYLREMGWVNGRPKMVSERYLGTGAEIEALLEAREQQVLPERTRHRDFGAVAAAWGMLSDLGVADLIDQACPTRPSGLPLSPGTYLALAVLNRVTDPCSKRGFAQWWKTTAADRFTKISASALDTAGSGTPCTPYRSTRWPTSNTSWRYGSATGSAWTPPRCPWTCPTSPPASTPASRKRRSPSAARRNRNAPTCAWSDSASSSPAPAASRCSPTPIRVTNQTPPSSPT